MARFQKESHARPTTSSKVRSKDQSSAKSDDSKLKSSKQAKKAGKKSKRDSAGGDAIELVTGPEQHDPALTKDVSSLLKDLNFHQPPDAVEPRDQSPKRDEKKSKTRHEKPKKQNSVSKKVETVKLDPLPLPVPSATATTSKAKLVAEPSSLWHTTLAILPPTPKSLPAPSPAKLSELMDRASKLLAKDAEVYQASSASTGSGASDAHFLQAILARGTLSDRLSALTLLVQGSPIHNTKALDALKGLAERGRGKGGREEGLKAVRCVVDWWVGGGAPNRKLRYFRDQPLLHPGVTDAHLLVWYFEDWLKKYFFSILQILETFSLDPLVYVRTQSLAFISTLLREKPEQEQNLLRLLVNKLGDTEKSICSRASFHLLQLLQAHPNMKAVIVREIKALVFRPAASTSAAAQAAALATPKPNTRIVFSDAADSGEGKKKSSSKGRGKEKDARAGSTNMERWNSHAWYYAAVTLNQVLLTASASDREVARTLVGTYFEMFEEILGSGTKADTQKAVTDDGASDDGVDEKDHGRKGHKGKGKAKAKEVKGEAGFAEVEDESSRMISAILAGVNRALPFAKVDVSSENDGFRTHLDTLFLITHKSTFNISLQALMLILQITTSLATAPSPSASSTDHESFATTLTDRFYRTLYASLTDSRLSTSNKQAMYLNLVFKALKVDRDMERVRAFVRRFVQILAAGVGGAGAGAEFTAGGLYLLGELFSTVPALKSMVSGSMGAADDAVDTKYDPHKRDPKYAHASASPLCELLPLMNHYHPAIALHARQLLTSTPITASPDLALNTLTHFLDRFVYKNPKKPRTHGPSAMQPAATHADGTSVKLVRGEVSEGALMNEEEFLKRRQQDVPVDQLFFHKFFTRKREKEREKAAKVGKRKGHRSDSESGTDSDDEAVQDNESVGDAEAKASDDGGDSDAGEAEIWKAMKASLPAELEDDDLSDGSDDIPSGLDEVDSDDAESELSGAESVGEDHGENEDEDGSDALSLAEASDADDLLSLDAEVSAGLIEYDGSDKSDVDDGVEEEWGGIGSPAAKTQKRKRNEERTSRRKRLRALPTFASYEDYAKLIEDGPEDNV